MKFVLAAVCGLVLSQFFGIVASAEELRILCWEGYASQSVVDGFKKYAKEKLKKDVSIKVTNVSSPNEWFDALRSGSHELLGGVAHNLPKSPRWKMVQSHLLAQINLKHIPNYQYIVKSLRHADYITQDGKVYGVPYTFGPYGLIYNSAIIKEEPKSWKIFFDEKYKQKYALSADYYEANIYLAALAFGIDRSQIFDFDKLNTPDIKNFVNRLAQNTKTYWIGVDTAKDLKGLALAAAWGFSLPELNRLGEPWKMAYPKEGTTGWVDNWVMPASIDQKPELKGLAEEWINYALGREVQLALIRNIGSFPVVTNINDLVTKEEIRRFSLNDLDSFMNNFILWQPLDVRATNGFKDLWDTARGLGASKE